MIEAGKGLHRTTYDGIYDDQNSAVNEMGISTVFVPRLYPVLLFKD